MGKMKKKAKRNTNAKVPYNFNNTSTDYSMLIKELSSLTKKEGLVIGTNAVLRHLQKKSLAAVFLFSKIASSCIYHSLSLWCQSTDTELVHLRENKYILGPDFPKSVTYGIQKKSLDSLPSISMILRKLKTSKSIRTQDSDALNQVNNAMDFDTESTKKISIEVDHDEVQKHPETVALSESLSFHHEYHSKIPKTIRSFKENDFLGVTQLDFPQYDVQPNPVKVRHIKKKIKSGCCKK